jgi:hypothetical protein
LWLVRARRRLVINPSLDRDELGRGVGACGWFVVAGGWCVLAAG